ncbi:MAG: galactose-1-phosphate uridylyltransferase [Thermodesulfobacteriota bacterium]
MMGPFEIQTIVARFVSPSGTLVDKPIQVRTNPITGRTCRITVHRGEEREPGTEALPDPPPFAEDRSVCPFCIPAVESRTPRFSDDITVGGRFRYGTSILFPNLFPYGAHSAVCIFDDRHFVEIGTASTESYRDGFLNAIVYLQRMLVVDPASRYMAITQNHLPSAGGSLLHPHLQIQADPLASNHHRDLGARAASYRERSGRYLFSDYLTHETTDGSRMIGTTGRWQWLAAFAPEGFFEIWAVLPGATRLEHTDDRDWAALAGGILAVQRYYRSLNRNGYNLGLLLIEDPSNALELRVVMTVRSNYAPWVRSDFTGFEVGLGDMATFTLPERIASEARKFFEETGTT